MSDVKYKILIIGANRGIGNELANRFAVRGHTVYGTFRPQSREDDTVRKMLGTGSKIIGMELDFTDERSIIQAASTFPSDSFDILINCAGLYYPWDNTPYMDLTADDLLGHFKVNTLGPFLTSKYFLPHLARAPIAKIINISSDFASISDNSGGNACYRISKAGLNQLTKTMAMDLLKEAPDVHTIAVHPGYVPTKMTGYVGNDDMEECMSSLVHLVEIFATVDAPASLVSGGYVKWNGETMVY